MIRCFEYYDMTSKIFEEKQLLLEANDTVEQSLNRCNGEIALEFQHEFRLDGGVISVCKIEYPGGGFSIVMRSLGIFIRFAISDNIPGMMERKRYWVGGNVCGSEPSFGVDRGNPESDIRNKVHGGHYA
jgi:hypothetical protein